MRGFEIILLCIAAAITYGILHDQVTARICIEYFTIGHPRVTTSESPTVIAITWGVIATWWMGALLGMPLAAACRLGRWPRLTAADLVRPLIIALALMMLVAALAGVVGSMWAPEHLIRLTGMANRIPEDRHVRFMIAAWAHTASYMAGIGAGIGLLIWALRHRRAAASV
ncbi:MAG: hypothetical protein KDA21_06325 [Phycisphaerales bacterium]|nr:hypothetical protein [Phycisphaerales bacterium]